MLYNPTPTLIRLLLSAGGLLFIAIYGNATLDNALSVNLLARHLPQRLVDALLPQEWARRKAAELSRTARLAIVDAVQKHSITPSATAGLKKAEACSGGVNTDEVDPKTMRSRVCENLFVVGELLDVTGLLGGYNLHWAWASGMAAARELARHMAGNNPAR